MKNRGGLEWREEDPKGDPRAGRKSGTGFKHREAQEIRPYRHEPAAVDRKMK